MGKMYLYYLERIEVEQVVSWSEKLTKRCRRNEVSWKMALLCVPCNVENRVMLYIINKLSP